MKTIYFDMDGTIAGLYNIESWLDDIINQSTRPYEQANTLLNMSSLARILNRLQRQGYNIGIISWLAKNSCEEYDKRVTQAKREWLRKHLPSVQWNEIHILKYGTPKHQVAQCGECILFDDEELNRKTWKGLAFDEKNIINILKEF